METFRRRASRPKANGVARNLHGEESSGSSWPRGLLDVQVGSRVGRRSTFGDSWEISEVHAIRTMYRCSSSSVVMINVFKVRIV